MSVISKTAVGILAAGLLLSSGATAAFAESGTVSEGTAVVEESVTVITQADVDVAKAEFKQAQADALSSEKQARATAAAQEKAQHAVVKNAKGTAKKAAQQQLQAIQKANQTSLKKLVAANKLTVNAAKAEYERVAAAFEAQQAATL